LGERETRFVFQHSEEYSLIGIRDVADYEIKDGRQISVWPAPGVALKDVEIYLFGQAWASLCHQRRALPLHASAIVTGEGITAFAGHSGAGKSTTGGLLHALGYELIADDILPVSFNQESIAGAWPYLRRLKLHRDPIGQLALPPSEVVSERLDAEKYFVRPKFTGGDKWRPLERLYLLDYVDSGSRPYVEQLTGADAVRAIVDQTYLFNYILGTRQFGDHLALCSRVAAGIRVFRLCRPKLTLGEAGKELGSLIRAHIEDQQS
jgi:hypothetical protein